MFAFKSRWIIFLSLFMSGYGSAQYISEFHYDNAGSDVGEFIEVVIHNPQPEDLSNYRIYIYNGADSMVNNDRSLSGLTPNCVPDSCFYVWSTQSLLQNDVEAMALVYHNESDTIIFDFISYEGIILAMDGPAEGLTSTDVGVSEDGSTPVGWSIQLDDSGTWVAGPATPGSINPIELLYFTGQYLENEGGVLLEWRTASELNNSYFEVQKSHDEIMFTPEATIEGAEYSQETLSYSYMDTDPYSRHTSYRLKQVDLDGRHTYSAVVRVDCPLRNSLSDLVPVFQNRELSFVENGYRDKVDVTIYDNLGRKLVYREKVYTSDVIPVNVSRRGIIYYLIRSGDEIHSGSLLSMSP